MLKRKVGPIAGPDGDAAWAAPTVVSQSYRPPETFSRGC